MITCPWASEDEENLLEEREAEEDEIALLDDKSDDDSSSEAPVTSEDFSQLRNRRFNPKKRNTRKNFFIIHSWYF